MSYTERHLPHWQPEGAAVFVTWRLYGSLPASVEALKSESAGKRFVAFDRDIDKAATGPRWLGDDRIAQCVADARHYGEDQLHLYRLRAVVPMINHVNILIYPEAELSRITKAIKNFTARRANTILGRTGQPFWQDESRPLGAQPGGVGENRPLHRRESGGGRVGLSATGLALV